MSDYDFVRFVDRHAALGRWNPEHLAFLGLLPNRIAHIRVYEDHLTHFPPVYYQEVSRT